MTTLKPVAIRRGDGFGYQLAARMISEVVCDKLSIPYIHNKIPNQKFHNKSQACVDYMFETITGEKNETTHDLNRVDLYTNWPHIIKKAFSGERKIPCFLRSSFNKYSSHFMNSNPGYSIMDNNVYNIVVHIRRGDVMADDYGRCMKDDECVKLISKGLDHGAKSSGNKSIKLYIETDSPDAIKDLASEFDASVNTISDHARKVIQSPIDNIDQPEWNRCICMIQALYNMGSADVFIPSRSSFSVVGGLCGTSKIFSQRFKLGRVKDPALLFPTGREELGVSMECDRLKHDMIWLHYLPIIDPDSVVELHI